MTRTTYINYLSTGQRSRWWHAKQAVKFLLCYIYPGWFVRILLSLRRRQHREPKKYRIAVCAIFKNEAPFLKEWIEYHRLVGVEHFYLYNNFSDDAYRGVLEPYLKAGIAELIDWPVPYGQSRAYADCFEKFGFETDWLGYIDLDEFVCPKYDHDLHRWLRKYRKYPCVLMNWKMFGTSGELRHDPQRLVIEQYTACWPCLTNVPKSFINTDFEFRNFTKTHYFPVRISVFGLRIPVRPVNEFKRFVTYGVYPRPWLGSCSTIQINHYWSKSYENYIVKDFVKTDVAAAANETTKKSAGRFEYHELNNTGRDYTILRFLVFLRLRMAGEKDGRYVTGSSKDISHLIND